MDACAAVYVKDAASATSVKGNLGEAAVKSALVASGAPAPTTVSAPVEKAAGEAVSTPCEIVEKIIKSWQEDPDKDRSCLPRWTRNYSDCMFALNVRKPLCT